ncbi:MAG TPA: protein kinase [Thermoanaerobaculia bacterium]|nr:protein kinase [Thermoanaerobaculia bacterium]
MIGSTLGHYEITGLLGRGGMGEVYAARDSRLGRTVAIKVLLQDVAQRRSRQARFEREARLLASLNHPNIATVYDFSSSPTFQGKDTYFIVMEFVKGKTLADRIAGGPLPLGTAVRILADVAEGLAAAHDRRVVHRDLKPSNIMVTPDGRVKILDFGLAKAVGLLVQEFGTTLPDFEIEKDVGTDQDDVPTLALSLTHGDFSFRGGLLGTPGYMSPEQMRGEALRAPTDVWSFGCCLFEAITGERAFSPDVRAVSPEPAWEKLDRAPIAVRGLIRECLAEPVSQRPSDMRTVALVLRGAQLRSDGQQPDEQFADSDALERRLFEMSQDLLCIAGLDGKFRRINPAFQRALGWTSAELLGRPFFDFVHPADIAATESEMVQLASGLPTISFENRYKCSDGQYLRLQWTAQPDPDTGLIFAVARIAGAVPE